MQKFDRDFNKDLQDSDDDKIGETYETQEE